MAECRQCGAEIRESDDVVDVNGVPSHVACVEAAVGDDESPEHRHARAMRDGPGSQRRGVT
jgi:hypothetical protein